MIKNKHLLVLATAGVFLCSNVFSLERERPLSFYFKKKSTKKQVAAVLAFPIIGATGAHRIYLGTEPLVPVTYTATLGGCFGILPLIDFIAILSEKDISKFENNPKVFMWVK